MNKVYVKQAKLPLQINSLKAFLIGGSLSAQAMQCNALLDGEE